MRSDLGARRSICIDGSRRNPEDSERRAPAWCTRDGARDIRVGFSAPLGHDTVLDIAPQRDDQFARERHNADAPCPLAGAGKAPLQTTASSALSGCHRTQHHAI